MSSQASETACQLCFPGAKNYGELVPDYFLVEHEDQWFLVDPNGHNKLFIFDGEPTRDPARGKSNQEIDNASEDEWEEWNQWRKRCERSHSISNSMRDWSATEGAMSLGASMYQHGWRDPDQRTELSWDVESRQGPLYWLYEVAANLIARSRDS